MPAAEMDSNPCASVGLEFGVGRGSISQSRKAQRRRQQYQHRCLLKSKKVQRLTTLDVIIATAVVLSVLIMLFEATYIGYANMRRFSNLAQAALAFVFLLEFGYRAFKSSDVGFTVFFFWGKDAPWNICDLILNTLGVLDIIIDSWEGRFVHGVATTRMFRIFRLFRIFASSNRLFRIFASTKFLNDVGKVLHTAIIQMMNFSLVVTITLTIFSVAATNMLYDFQDEDIADCYQNLGASFWSLFKVLTMDGWIAHVEQVLSIHPSLLYFYGVFVFLSISSVSIVPAIFIEIQIEDREKTRKRRERLKLQLQRRRRAPIAGGLNAGGLNASALEALRDDANINQSDSDTSCWSGSQPFFLTYSQNASEGIYSPDRPAGKDSPMMLRGAAQGHALLPGSQPGLSIAGLDPLVSGQGQDAAVTDFRRCRSNSDDSFATMQHEILRLKHELQSMLLAVTDDIFTQLGASHSECSLQRQCSYTGTVETQKDGGHALMERSPSNFPGYDANGHGMAQYKIDSGPGSSHGNVSAGGTKDASYASLSYPHPVWNVDKMSANYPQV